MICVYADQTIVLENGKIGLGEVLTITMRSFPIAFWHRPFLFKNVFCSCICKTPFKCRKPEIGQIILGKETESNLFEHIISTFPNEVSRDLVMFMQLPKTHSEK